jgi:hypothetical protein
MPPGAWVARAGALAGMLLVVAAVAGCGENIVLPDLFVVQRTGGAPGERLTMVVNEGGGVRCLGKPLHPAVAHATHQLSDPQLVEARGLQEELQGPSAKHLSLSPRPGSVFRYSVRDPEGAVRFADNSAGQPAVFHHLALFVLEVAQQVCGLPQ